MQRPLLYELFEAARLYDRSTGHQALGFDNYLALLEALQMGIGFNSREQLLQLCVLLWLRPHHDEADFRKELGAAMILFQQNVTDQQQSTAEENPDSTPTNTNQGKTANEEGKKKAPRAATNEPTPTPSASENTVIISFEKARPNADNRVTSTSEKAFEKEIHQHNYWLKGNYFEFSSRRLQQDLRALRSGVDSLTKKEFDLDATIEATAKKGYFQEMSWQKTKEWRSDLVVLIDNGSSMVAFQPMIDELIEVLRKDSDQQQQLNVFYFDRAPVKHLFRDEDHLQGVELDYFAKKHKSPVLILSDGGAATGGLDRDRLQNTTHLLKALKNHRVAWLNPMPRHRWKRTTADYISYYVNMFDANGLEFGNAVRVLKAKLHGKKLLT